MSLPVWTSELYSLKLVWLLLILYIRKKTCLNYCILLSGIRRKILHLFFNLKDMSVYQDYTLILLYDFQINIFNYSVIMIHNIMSTIPNILLARYVWILLQVSCEFMIIFWLYNIVCVLVGFIDWIHLLSLLSVYNIKEKVWIRERFEMLLMFIMVTVTCWTWWDNTMVFGKQYHSVTFYIHFGYLSRLLICKYQDMRRIVLYVIDWLTCHKYVKKW